MSRSFWLGYLSDFGGVTLHNGSTMCALGYVPTAGTPRDTRVLLPNGTMFNPNLKSDGSYFVPLDVPGEVSQRYMFSSSSKAGLAGIYASLESSHNQIDTLTATLLGGGSRICTAQFYTADFSETQVGQVENGFTGFCTITFLQFTRWQ